MRVLCQVKITEIPLVTRFNTVTVDDLEGEDGQRSQVYNQVVRWQLYDSRHPSQSSVDSDRFLRRQLVDEQQKRTIDPTQDAEPEPRRFWSAEIVGQCCSVMQQLGLSLVPFSDPVGSSASDPVELCVWHRQPSDITLVMSDALRGTFVRRQVFTAVVLRRFAAPDATPCLSRQCICCGTDRSVIVVINRNNLVDSVKQPCRRQSDHVHFELVLLVPQSSLADFFRNFAQCGEAK